jgi:hypothetical protein
MIEPVPLTKGQLLAELRNMLRLIEADDSFEGSITYMLPSDEDEELRGAVPGEHYAMVIANYRTGNSMGQGGMRIVGKVGFNQVDPNTAREIEEDDVFLYGESGQTKTCKFCGTTGDRYPAVDQTDYVPPHGDGCDKCEGQW